MMSSDKIDPWQYYIQQDKCNRAMLHSTALFSSFNLNLLHTFTLRIFIYPDQVLPVSRSNWDSHHLSTTQQKKKTKNKLTVISSKRNLNRFCSGLALYLWHSEYLIKVTVKIKTKASSFCLVQQISC